MELVSTHSLRLNRVDIVHKQKQVSWKENSLLRAKTIIEMVRSSEVLCIAQNADGSTRTSKTLLAGAHIWPNFKVHLLKLK